MRYLQVSAGYYLNLKTFKFVPKSELRAGTLDVPFFCWKHGIAKSIKQAVATKQTSSGFQNIYMKTQIANSLHLNGVVIFFPSSDLEEVVIYIGDTPDKFTLVFKAGTSLSPSSSVSYLRSFDYWWTLPDGSQHEYYMSGIGKFEKIEGLNYLSGIWKPYSQFQYGLLPRQLQIQYRGKILGSCYAFLFGNWALLLDDGLRFDSVVTLFGTQADILIVSDILYTVNKYVLKSKILLG